MSINGLPVIWTALVVVACLLVIGVVVFAVYALVRGHKETEAYEQSEIPDSGVQDMIKETERTSRNDLESLNVEDLKSDGGDSADDSLPTPSPFLDDYVDEDDYEDDE